MAERRRRSRTYSVEETLQNVVAESYGIDLGLASYDSEGNFVNVAEEVVTGIIEEVHDDETYVEPEEDFDDDFEEEMAEYLADKDEDTPVAKLPAKRPVMRRGTLYSGGGKHLEPKEKKAPSEAVEKAKKAGAGAFEKAKSFFKESVIPLFIEEQEPEEGTYVEAPYEEEAYEEPYEEPGYEETTEEDENPSFKEMFTSAKAGVGGFFKGAADFVNSKIIDPVREKMVRDEYEEFDDADEAEHEERREALHVVNRRRRSEPVVMDAEYSEEVEDEGEFFEEDDEEPGFLRKVWDRFVNPEEDYEDDMSDWEEEDEDPSFIEAVRELLHRPKKTNVDSADAEYEEVSEEKPKGRLAAAIHRVFFEDDFEEYDNAPVEVEEEFYPEQEDLESIAKPDPAIYDAIIAERKKQSPNE